MALTSYTHQSTSENIPPVRSAITGSAQKQLLQDNPSDPAIGHQRERVDGTSSRDGQAKQVSADTDGHASLQEGYHPARNHPARRVYDIPTLLRLKETQSAVPVMLRVKPEAIAENIFQYMGAAISRRQSTRSRAFSDASNISMGNPQPYGTGVYSTIRPRYLNQPVRQPYAPPETSILQRHDGFVRFLKQHASPPSHRVTAGGRIVPAGPSSPPPMLDFGSLNGLVRDHPTRAKSFQKDSRSSQANVRAQDPKATSSMTLGDYLRSNDGDADGVSFHHAAQTSSAQSAQPFNDLPLGYQPFVASVVQPQAAMVPLGIYPDGSTLVSYNGMNYRATWSGMSLNMEPFQPLQLPLDQQYCTQAYPEGQLNSTQYGSIPRSSVLSVPLASATNFTRPNVPTADLPFQHEAQDDDALSLKAQLTDLDKHLALYHYDITPADRATLVAQRRCLVEEIDRIRLCKEKPKHNIPIIAPSAAGLSVPHADPRGLPPKEGNMSKHLSPAAPAFVPRKDSGLLSTAISMRTASQQSRHEQVGIRAPSGADASAPEAKDIAKSSPWMGHSGQDFSSTNAQKVAHNEPSSSFSVLDPSDPAMRVIEHEDIEYAARYLCNGTKDDKIYCTTIIEFQEAIRRVREQARLYGCAGGQSKDPAYDAEQDLWWAICDHDPIPLPSKNPDHVTNPRPWNWNDSAFNYRRKVASNSLEPGCQQGRESLRVLGRDSSMTDKMKGNVGVPCSYFARNGRLPSVSFRDFAYDQDGKRKMIQSDTAASAAYAENPKLKIHLDLTTTTDSQRKLAESSSFSGAPKELSSSEVNIQSRHCASKSQSKSPEEKSQPLKIPQTPENRRFLQILEVRSPDSATQVSTPNLPIAHGVVDSKKSELATVPYCAHVEDYPETPAERGTRLASIEVLTPPPQTTSIQGWTGPLSADESHTLMGAPVQANVPHLIAGLVSNCDPKKDELNSIWYQTPLDEVTQKYMDNVKAYNVFKQKQACEQNGSLVAARDHPQSLEPLELVTESKKSWGPEEVFTPNNANRPEYIGSEHTGVSPVAKVKFPSGNSLQAPILPVDNLNSISTGSNPGDTIESGRLGAVSVPNFESSDSRFFLRKMLKSPRYTSTQPVSVLGQIGSALVNRINGTKRTQGNLAENVPRNQGKKQIHTSTNTTVVGGGLSATIHPSRSTSPAKAPSNLAVSKAQSSLASSTIQAQGFLPQFEGAGKAHTSSIYRDQGIQPHPQVRLPSEALCGDDKHATEVTFPQVQNSSACIASTPYHTPVSFGYDGGRDSPPSRTTDFPRHGQAPRPAFDTMGVTLADYDNKREDTNNAWHHGIVNDFFGDVRERELRTIASYRRDKARNLT